MPSRALVRAVALSAVLGVGLACDERALEPAGGGSGERDAGDKEGPPRSDAAADAGTTCEGTAQVEPIRELDLLFVIDNSLTMAEEQAFLSWSLPAFLRRLAPPESGRRLHLGVVSTDLGVQPSVFLDDEGRCDPPGDYALLQRLGHRDEAGGPAITCRELAARFIEHVAGRDALKDSAFALSCITELGTQGCGYEQAMESALRALWPDHGGRSLAGGPAAGHGDGVNAGFLEPESDAMLAVIALGDEDDCSHPDATFLWPSALLNGDDPEQARWRMQGLRTRCVRNPDQLYPLQRYLDGWRALRGGRAERVFFAAISGAPPDAVDAKALAGVLDDSELRDRFYADLLAHPDMQIEFEPLGPNNDPQFDFVRPACNAESGPALPARRYTELARSFGAYGMVQSSCQLDYSASMEAIAARIDQLMSEPRCR